MLLLKETIIATLTLKWRNINVEKRYVSLFSEDFIFYHTLASNRNKEKSRDMVGFRKIGPFFYYYLKIAY